MTLTRLLRAAGYDLIDSPIRNHRVLQIWLQRGLDPIQHYSHVIHAFKGSNELRVERSTALNINHSNRNEFKFNIGITVLEGLLESVKLGNFGLSTILNAGRSLTISFEDTFADIVTIESLESYIREADFDHKNERLLKDANRNNLIVITGVLYAHNIRSILETDYEITAEIEANIQRILDGRVEARITGSNRLELNCNLDQPFPVAIKANKLIFDRSVFETSRVITDNGNTF